MSSIVSCIECERAVEVDEPEAVAMCITCRTEKVVPTIDVDSDDKLAILRKIVERHQYAYIQGVLVDLFTAQAILSIYDALSDENKARMMAYDIRVIANVTWKLYHKHVK